MRRWQAVLLSFILPPAGICIALFRSIPPGAGAFGKLVRLTGRLLLAGFFAILTLVYVVKLGILHVQVTGAGYVPLFSFRSPQQDEVTLEKHREAMRASGPALVGATTTPAAEVPAPAPAGAQTGKTASREPSASPAPPAAVPLPQPPWGEFRGTQRDGVYREGAILTEWPSEGLPPLWKQPIGGGFASFAIAQGRAFTIEQRRENEVVAAYDLLSGRELWTHSWPARYRDPTGDGPRATPTWHDGLVYALGATGEFHVLDAATGKLVWSKNVLADAGAENVTWGVSNSPLIVDDQVIVTAGRGGHTLLAYHKKTGRRLWSALEDQAAYCSPMLVTLAGVRQIILVTALRALGVRPEDGQLLWDYPWRTQYDVNSAQPIVVSSHQVLVSSAYDHGSVLLEITANDKGLTAKPVWENKNLKNRFNSSVLHNGSIYGFDEGIFACIDARSGERKWKGGRYGYGQALLLGEHVLVLSEAGELVLLKASPDAPQEVARFVALEGKTWNHPAVSGGILLVRNAREMAAFRIAP